MQVQIFLGLLRSDIIHFFPCDFFDIQTNPSAFKSQRCLHIKTASPWFLVRLRESSDFQKTRRCQGTVSEKNDRLD